MARTVQELVESLGRQVRELRIAGDLTQAELAEAANVSLSAVQSLERGAGTTLATVVAVVRALGRPDWLEQLAPPRPPSPLAILRAARAAERSPRQRVRHPRPAPPDDGGTDLAPPLAGETRRNDQETGH